MAVSPSRKQKKFFTLAEANATLPLVRVIVRDIAELAVQGKERHERLARLQSASGEATLSPDHEEELREIERELERDQVRMQEYVQELSQVGVELKDFFTGLIDFPAQMGGREVYLCWKLGEPEVAHWHELDAGFMGRQRVTADAVMP